MSLPCGAICPTVSRIDGERVWCDLPSGHEGEHIDRHTSPDVHTHWTMFSAGEPSGWTGAQGHVWEQSTEPPPPAHVVTMIQVTRSKVRPTCSCGAYGLATTMRGHANAWEAHHLADPDCTACTRYGVKAPLVLS